MSKIFVSALLFVFINLFSGAVEAVSVPSLEPGKHVYVVRAEERVGMFETTELETQLSKLHYPTYVVVFSPGYRTVDMPVISEQLRKKWEHSPGYDPEKSVLLIHSRFPPWYGLHTPAWYKKTAPNGDMSLGRDPIPQILAFLTSVNQAMTTQDAEVQRLKQAAEDARLAADKAAADKAKAEADRLDAAKAFLQVQVTEFSKREVGAEICCPTEFHDAKKLEELVEGTKAGGEIGSIYELGAKLYNNNRSIDKALLRQQEEQRRSAWKMVGVAVLVGILFLFLFRLFTRFKKLGAQLKGLLEKIPDIPTYDDETQHVVHPHVVEFAGIREEILAMIETLAEQKGFRLGSPVAFGQLRQQAKSLITRVEERLQAWRPIGNRIQQIQGGALEQDALVNPLRTLREGNHHAIYRDLLGIYEGTDFSQQAVYGGLEQLLARNPFGYQHEVARRRSRLEELTVLFNELDQLLAEFVQLTEGMVLQRQTVISQLFEMVHQSDPLGSIIARLRWQVGKLRE